MKKHVNLLQTKMISLLLKHQSIYLKLSMKVST